LAFQRDAGNTCDSVDAANGVATQLRHKKAHNAR
jgi:hypothetical protein